MAMLAGQLRNRITIQRRSGATDAIGQPLPDAWEDVATIWANVRHLSGSETIKAAAPASTVRASIRIRWRTGIDAGMRVMFAGRIYDITAVLQDDVGRRHIDLVVDRVD